MAHPAHLAVLRGLSPTAHLVVLRGLSPTAHLAVLRGLSPTATTTLHRRSVFGITKFWWGHKTIEDVEDEKKHEQKKQLMRWRNPEILDPGISASTALVERPEHGYLPMRIENEAQVIQDINWSRFNYTDMFQITKQPILAMFFDRRFYMHKKICFGYKKLALSQLFIKERLLTLGPDLAAAHFLLHRGCRVRFKGHPEWTELNRKRQLDIPDGYEKGWYIEAIDASQTLLVYEGFQNVRNLIFLSYLDLSYSPLIDEWCLDRLTGEYQYSLEYLDLSGCRLVDWNAIESLWRFKHLRVLVLNDMDHIHDLKLLCLMLLEVNPDLQIKGVDYMDLKLLEGTEHQHLIDELDQLYLNAGSEDAGSGTGNGSGTGSETGNGSETLEAEATSSGKEARAAN